MCWILPGSSHCLASPHTRTARAPYIETTGFYHRVPWLAVSLGCQPGRRSRWQGTSWAPSSTRPASLPPGTWRRTGGLDPLEVLQYLQFDWLTLAPPIWCHIHPSNIMTDYFCIHIGFQVLERIVGELESTIERLYEKHVFWSLIKVICGFNT